MAEINGNQLRCDFKGFIQRALYKISGQKIISFFFASVALIVALLLFHPDKNTEKLVSEAMVHIKTLALALMGVKGIQNVVGIVKNGDSRE
jgi:hypothetical protein